MKRPVMALAALALSSMVLATRMAWAAEPAEVSLYVFDGDLPLGDAEVLVDGQPLGATNADGSIRLSVPSGARHLVVRRGGENVLDLQLDLQDDENAQLIATLRGEAEPHVLVESSHRQGASSLRAQSQQDLGPPGELSGRIINFEDGKPVVGARVYVSGTPIDIVTDADGKFSAPLSAGTYSISVIAADYSTLTLDGIEIAAEETTERAIELTPAGFELPEFVVLEPFVEGSLAAFVEEKRTSSAVADILGAEQISRAGDSDAAGALKRVTGLTLVDGKFIYVRGLGERYSSTLLNAGQIPSPDPTRRVVPLDLFPASLLSGIVVQKTYTADMPGEFAGGTVQLRTRGVPESFLLKASVGAGYNDGTTGDDGLRYRGGNRDWTGRDDGTRAPPSALDLDQANLPADPLELESLGESLAAKGYSLRTDAIGPDSSASFEIGDLFKFSDGDWSLGYIGAIRQAQGWDSREEERNVIALGTDGLRPVETGQRNSTERAIDGSVFLAAGLQVGELHSVTATGLLLRQTTDDAQFTDTEESGERERRFSLEWIENELESFQFSGEHSFPALSNLAVFWQMTQSDASRLAPNAREYRFRFDEATQQYVAGVFSNQQRFEDLQDTADEYRLDLKLPINFSADSGVTLAAGASQFSKDRVSSIRRYTFGGSVPGGVLFTDIEDLFTPDRIGPASGQLRLREVTTATDSYTASQQLDAYYFMADAHWRTLSLNIGARQEDILQQVVTQQPFAPNPTPVVGTVDQKDLLPAATLTWAYSDKAQLRLAYSETLSRPDIREQSPANFIDPLLDVRVLGNPDLKQAEIENVDLRWEYYFSPTESFSVALFQKDFLNPIELVAVPASGDLLGIRNADTATNRGIEFDLYKGLGFVGSWQWLPWSTEKLPWNDLYLGVNYARIESEIDLGDDPGQLTNAVRPLQGQSPYVANLALSYLPEDGRTEATLLYNVSGARISRVGIRGIPDTLEQPFDQLDFTYSRSLPWDGWKVKMRVRNLLDPKAEFKVGNQVARSFNKGRELALSVEWKF